MPALQICPAPSVSLWPWPDIRSLKRYSNTTKTSRDDDFSNERTNRVWGSATKSVNPRAILANSDRQKSFKKDFKKPSDRQSAPRRKPRVFGPDGVKDI